MSAHIVSFAAVKRAVKIEAVLSRYGLLGALALRGANLTGRCPFCNGGSERHFRVSPEKNAWYCFGCKQGGNVLDFVAQREGMTLRAAALALNDWFGLGLVSGRPQPEEPAPPKEAPIEEPAANEPLTFALKTLDPAHPSLAALGLSEATVRHFGLGFCSKGLLKGRIAIPIENPAGELLAYAGLSADLEAEDRYLFPPKFHCSLEIFNARCLLAGRGEDKPTYLAAEILNALRLADAGIEPVVALFDGALSEPQVRILSDHLAPGSRLILAGAHFEARTVARLTDLFLVRTLSFDALLPGAPPVEALPAQ